MESSLTTKACIAPDSFDFTDKDMFSFGSHTGEHYGQVLFLRDLPAELSDKIISELSDLPIDMNITLHITNVEQGKALELVRRQIAFMEMEATGKQDQAVQKGRNADIAIPMETRRSYDEATKLLDLLENKNQRMFKVTLLVYTFADDIDTLQDNAFQIMATARKNNVKIDRLALRQREGIMSVAPIGKNLVNVSRTLTTASTAIFVPFTTMELYQKGGMYYGLNALSRNLMIVGTWKGTFDEWPTADSIYWSYTFSADGTYSFTNGTTTEAGTYTITSDPNNNYYHSSMQLTFDGGERTMQFYFTTTNPVKMITDDQTDPTYLKSLV